MIPMKLAWILLEGILLYSFLYFGSSAALAFAGLLAAVPVLCFPVNLYVSRYLRTSIDVSGNLRKGERGAITVTLENPARLPVLRISCGIEGQNQLNGELGAVTIMTCAMPGRKQRVTLKTDSDYCGRIRIWVNSLRLYDCFGLIGVPCKVDAVGHMTVQPETFAMDITVAPSPNSAEDSDQYASDRPGADLSETYQIREYVPGDSPRQIHWKLSNKFDRLIVRDPSLPITRPVLVFWERTGGSGNRELVDAQAETVISLCRSLLEQSIPFTLGWNDTDRELCVLHEIHNMDELVGIIPRILRATGAQTGASGAGLLLQTGADALCGHMVYVAEEPQNEVLELRQFGKVTMLLCGSTPVEDAVIFDAARYTEQLAQIEI